MSILTDILDCAGQIVRPKRNTVRAAPPPSPLANKPKLVKFDARPADHGADGPAPTP